MDNVTKEQRSKIMSSVKSKNTTPEVALRKALWKKGVRFRLHYGPERVDIAVPSKKVAIFVDGCFWHLCPKHGEFPTSNRSYWVPKLKRNARRDKEANARLKKAGWRVVRVWEHDVPKNSELIAVKIKKILETASLS